MTKIKYASLRNFFSFILYISIAISLLLFVLGGIVRVTGSGLGCPDWPLCYGQLFPPLELKAIIEYTHRFVAMIFGIFILFVSSMSLFLYRRQKIIIFVSSILFILLIVQGLLGAYTVMSELNPWMVTLHLSNGYLLIAFLVVLKIFTTYLEPKERNDFLMRRRLPKNLAILNILLVGFFFLVSVSGAYLRGEEASFQCLSWPLCHSAFIPDNIISQVNMLHRYVVGLFTLYMIWVGYLGYKFLSIYKNPMIKNMLTLTLFLYVMQIVIGAIMALTSMNAVLRVIHLFGSAFTWTVIIMYVTTLIITKTQKNTVGEIKNE